MLSAMSPIAGKMPHCIMECNGIAAPHKKRVNHLAGNCRSAPGRIPVRRCAATANQSKQ
jgi:hypothetical protein